MTRPSKHKPSRTLARVDFKDIRDLTFVRVTLTKAGMRAFGRAKSLKVLVKVTVRDRAGNRASLQLPYTLRR